MLTVDHQYPVTGIAWGIKVLVVELAEATTGGLCDEVIVKIRLSLSLFTHAADTITTLCTAKRFFRLDIDRLWLTHAFVTQSEPCYCIKLLLYIIYIEILRVNIMRIWMLVFILCSFGSSQGSNNEMPHSNLLHVSSIKAPVAVCPAPLELHEEDRTVFTIIAILSYDES